MDDAPLPQLIRTLSKLPGLGPRSAQRIVLFLLKEEAKGLEKLIADAMAVQQHVKRCERCGNLDSASPCHICTDPRRDVHQLCIVEKVSDLWAIEQAHFFRGRFHVLGGLLSAMDGVGPAQLNTVGLRERLEAEQITEVTIALSATIEGQTTTYFLSDLLAEAPVRLFTLSQGVPFGGELNYLDEGTLSTAFSDKRALSSCAA